MTLNELYEVVELAKTIFHNELIKLKANGGMTKEVYIRYLTFQHHLTKGVQRHFLLVAAHPTLAGRRKLRDFLFNFALEEEPHFDIAKHDLENLGVSPGSCPIDVEFWWTYYDNIVNVSPFRRLGATCVLENLGAGAGELGHQILEDATFLNEKNTRFLEIHFHEELPHGDQIFAALKSVKLAESEIEDLVYGARIGALLYFRMARWAFGTDDLQLALNIKQTNAF